MRIDNCRCGGEAEAVNYQSGYWIRCIKCYIRTHNEDTLKEAVKIWRKVMRNEKGN